MTTRPLVDPELAALLDQIPTVKLTEESVKQVRAMDQTQKLPNLPTFPDIEVTECSVPGPEGAPDKQEMIQLIRSAAIELTPGDQREYRSKEHTAVCTLILAKRDSESGSSLQYLQSSLISIEGEPDHRTLL